MSYKTFIADSESESVEFESELQREFGTNSFLELPDRIRIKIEKSWEKIFDMNFDIEYFARPFNEKHIQATFWELRVNEVVKVDKFKAR